MTRAAGESGKGAKKGKKGKGGRAKPASAESLDDDLDGYWGKEVADKKNIKNLVRRPCSAPV